MSSRYKGVLAVHPSGDCAWYLASRQSGGTGTATPTTVEIPITADVELNSNEPTSNKNAQNLHVGRQVVGNLFVIYRSLLFADMSVIPSGKTITSGQLIGYCTSFSVGGQAMLLREMAQLGWNEFRATWLQYATGLSWIHPGGDTLTDGQVPVTSPSSLGLKTFDVTGLVRNGYENRGKQFSVCMMKPEADEGIAGYATFRDHENGFDLQPGWKLRITYQ